jgi:hypothetical protein
VGGGRDLRLEREMRQKRLDVGASHSLGMACVVEEHVPVDPGDLGLLCLKRIVLEAYGVAHVIKQYLGTWFRGPYLPNIMG